MGLQGYTWPYGHMTSASSASTRLHVATFCGLYTLGKGPGHHRFTGNPHACTALHRTLHTTLRCYTLCTAHGMSRLMATHTQTPRVVHAATLALVGPVGPPNYHHTALWSVKQLGHTVICQPPWLQQPQMTSCLGQIGMCMSDTSTVISSPC